MDSVVLVSGGLDSVTLLYFVKKYLKENCYALTFGYGQRNIKEVEYAKMHTKMLGVPHKIFWINLQELLKSDLLTDNTQITMNKEPSAYVPFKNLIFISLALGFAESIGARKVYIGVHRGRTYEYWDTTENFIVKVNEIAKLRGFEVKAPFIRLYKEEIVALAIHLGVNLDKTMTCYYGTNCGKCPACIERKIALESYKKANIDDILQKIVI